MKPINNNVNNKRMLKVLLENIQQQITSSQSRLKDNNLTEVEAWLLQADFTFELAKSLVSQINKENKA